MAKRSFNDKLHDSKDLPKISILEDPKAIALYGGARLLIAPPIAYDEIMRRVPKGKLITSDRIRAHLAVNFGADGTCPLTAGIFINTAAQASLERGTDETPFWRTLKKDGELNEKYPEGIDGQKRRLELEGHTVIQKGKRYYVKDYEKKLFVL
ncbi:MAG: methylated DNA-protein cysteine methyltransferase [Clostridiales bacterium]|nr:methylated DNA-protein cysteine methyltransferase [Clostridiales bacterium]